MKIIHISDLHLNSKFKKANINKTNNLFHEINEAGFDHLVISGDITHKALPEEFEIFRKLLKKHNLLDSRKVTIVPGNHDIFGGVASAEDILNFTNDCRKADLEDKLTAFVNKLPELFTGVIFPDSEKFFPFIKIIDGAVLVGFNSSDKFHLFNNPMASNGKILKKDRKSVENILSKPEFSGCKKIAVIHHHFCKYENDPQTSQNTIWSRIESQTLKLRGKKKIIDFFKNNSINLVLHGHMHKSDNYQKDGIVFSNAAGSIDNGTDYYFYNKVECKGNAAEVLTIGPLIRQSFEKPAVNPYGKLVLERII